MQFIHEFFQIAEYLQKNLQYIHWKKSVTSRPLQFKYMLFKDQL